MNEILLIIGICASIVGCLVVALGKAYTANIIWAIFNPFMMIYNLRIGENAQAGLWGLYVFIAIFGIRRHMKARRKNIG